MIPIRYAVGLIAALLVAGCAEMRQDRTATDETLISATATVASVDQTTRQVTLTDAEGGSFTVVAGPEVRNLPQLAAGDQVQLDYYQGTTLSMASPDDTGEAVTRSRRRSRARGRQARRRRRHDREPRRHGGVL